MSEAARGTARGAGWRPWSQAWIERLPVAPLWFGLGLATAHLLAAALFEVVIAGRRPPGAPSVGGEAVSSALVFALLIGYGVAALAYARKGHRATLAALRPTLRCSDAELVRMRDALERFDARLLRAVGFVSAALSAVFTIFTTGLLDTLGPGNPRLIWAAWQNAIAFWLVSRTVAHDLRVSWLFSRWSQRFAAVEPLDQAPLAPLARRGLQSALLIVLAISIFTLVYGFGNLSPAVPLLQVQTVLLVGVALLLPSLGVHRRLRGAKRAELARLAGEIRSVRAAPEDASRLAALLTLRQHVEAAREWPFDLNTLGRFVLYAAIGVGSWLGGAVVERLLDALLG